MQLTLRDGQWAVSDEGQSGPPESPAILFMATFGGQKREKEKILAQKQLVLIDDVYNIRILRMRFFRRRCRRFFLTYTVAAADPDVSMAFLMAMKIKAGT